MFPPKKNIAMENFSFHSTLALRALENYVSCWKEDACQWFLGADEMIKAWESLQINAILCGILLLGQKTYATSDLILIFRLIM